MQAEELQNLCAKIENECGKIIVGHKDTVRLLIASILSRGHCLLIGVPGLAKTLLVQAMAKTLGVDFGRIQFTPDLMPSDIVGSEFVREVAGKLELEYRKGPLFTQLLLADEINRTPPKTQSALLEAMQEKRVTLAGQTHPLPEPFWVVATQNPIEQEGTYPLPEAQLDRFMFSLELSYTNKLDEVEILRRTTIGELGEAQAVTGVNELTLAQDYLRDTPVSDDVMQFAVDLSASTRPGTEHAHKIAKEYIEWGAGPRASQYLVLGAKAFALMEGRPAPEKRDVLRVAVPVLSHRVLVNYKATGDGLKSTDIIKQIAESIQA